MLTESCVMFFSRDGYSTSTDRTSRSSIRRGEIFISQNSSKTAREADTGIPRNNKRSLVAQISINNGPH